MTVVGLLGDMPTARYSGRIYKLPLVDPEAPASITYLNVREATLKRAYAETGDLVEATGTIVAELFKGAISFRLDAVAVERQAPAALPEARDTQTTVSALRRLVTARRPFPTKGQPSLTLIHSRASDAKVVEDFVGALAPGQAAAIRRVPTSMHDPAAIAVALGEARTDIVVVIRGGGDAASFAVFEDARVLEALSACPAYRVLGLGHTANRTLAEVLADHAASTPTAAGEHVKRGLAEASELARDAGLLQELRETLTIKDFELEQARRTAREAPVQSERPIDTEVAVKPFGAISPRSAFAFAVAGAVVAWILLKVF
ncbi:MAG: exodeoxyribonuclease VII large subunit [Janthinobacterium lividum]